MSRIDGADNSQSPIKEAARLLGSAVLARAAQRVCFPPSLSLSLSFFQLSLPFKGVFGKERAQKMGTKPGRAPKPLALTLTLALALVATLGLAPASARSLPLTDAGPHLNYGWGEPVRLRHLYTASRQGLFSYFLRIHSDGRVDGTSTQNRHSLLEIRAVSVRAVAIKGVHSSRYLCMEEEGRLHGMLRYSTDDCSFEEEMRPDGYNIYRSKKYGILVSLSNARQRQQFKGKEFLPLSHFLPMINTVPVESADFGEYGDTRQRYESDIFSSHLETDSMDPFGITSEVSSVQSPSFGK